MLPSCYHPSVFMNTVTAALSAWLRPLRSRWGQYIAESRPIDKARTWCALMLAAGGAKRGRRGGARGLRGERV